jgi:ubiquinone/menaquinone biosynthesis C-methylase UbiE
MSNRIVSRVADSPTVYDVVQLLAGYPLLARRLRQLIGPTTQLSVLDAGAGTGALGGLVGDTGSYVALEIDEGKLERLRQRRPHAEAIHGSVSSIPLSDNSVDLSLLVNVAHHLADDDLEHALSELSRVTRTRLIVADPVANGPLVGRALWRIDRGSYPRTAAELCAAIGRHLDVEEVGRLTLLHRFALISARVR